MIKVTISPTASVGAIGDIRVRAWTGVIEGSDKPVQMMVAMASIPKGVDASEFVPIPDWKDAQDWTPAVKQAMAEIWLASSRLKDDEARELAAMAKSRAVFRDPTMPERVCERAGCGTYYHGPGLYCCYACAEIDAV